MGARLKFTKKYDPPKGIPIFFNGQRLTHPYWKIFYVGRWSLTNQYGKLGGEFSLVDLMDLPGLRKEEYEDIIAQHCSEFCDAIEVGHRLNEDYLRKIGRFN